MSFEKHRIAKLEDDLNGVYDERNRVVVAIAHAVIKLGGVAGIARPVIEGWDPAWLNCCYVDLPGGEQVSWHFHDRDQALFAGLPAYQGKWDGHDTPTKYDRLFAWSQSL